MNNKSSKNNNESFFNAIITFILTIVLLVTSFLYAESKEEVASLKASAERAYQHIDSRVGSTALCTGELIGYNLKTWDNGKHWYQIKFSENWGMEIVGSVEEVFGKDAKCILGTYELLDGINQDNAIERFNSISHLTADSGLKVSIDSK